MKFGISNIIIAPIAAGNWQLATSKFYAEEGCIHVRVKNKNQMVTTIQASRL